MSKSFGLTFPGFQLNRNSEDEVAINISDRTKERMNLRIRKLTLCFRENSIADCRGRLNCYLNGWIGYFQLCTKESMYSFSRFDAHIRRRVRTIMVHQEKFPRHLFRHLLRRSIPRGMAWKAAYSIRVQWKCSGSFGMHKTYSNAWFAGRLVSLRQ